MENGLLSATIPQPLINFKQAHIMSSIITKLLKPNATSIITININKLKININLNLRPNNIPIPQVNWQMPILFLYFSNPHLLNSEIIFFEMKEFIPYTIKETAVNIIII